MSVTRLPTLNIQLIQSLGPGRSSEGGAFLYVTGSNDFG